MSCFETNFQLSLKFMSLIHKKMCATHLRTSSVQSIGTFLFSATFENNLDSLIMILRNRHQKHKMESHKTWPSTDTKSIRHIQSSIWRQCRNRPQKFMITHWVIGFNLWLTLSTLKSDCNEGPFYEKMRLNPSLRRFTCIACM